MLKIYPFKQILTILLNFKKIFGIVGKRFGDVWKSLETFSRTQKSILGVTKILINMASVCGQKMKGIDLYGITVKLYKVLTLCIC